MGVKWRGVEGGVGSGGGWVCFGSIWPEVVVVVVVAVVVVCGVWCDTSKRAPYSSGCI